MFFEIVLWGLWEFLVGMWLTGSVWKGMEGFAEKFSKDLDGWIFFENFAKLAEKCENLPKKGKSE